MFFFPQRNGCSAYISACSGWQAISCAAQRPFWIYVPSPWTGSCLFQTSFLFDDNYHDNQTFKFKFDFDDV